MTDAAEPWDFTPAPTRRRIAGWTPERQAAFIAALACGHTVGVAAAGVGLSARSAYQRRKAPGGAGFAEAWDVVLDAGSERLEQTALDRAINGERRTVFYRGKASARSFATTPGFCLLSSKRNVRVSAPPAWRGEVCEVSDRLLSVRRRC